MTTQRNENVLRRPTFSLPENLSPDGYRCIQVRIPDDQEHLQAFYGAVSLLAAWTSWQRDDTHGGTVAAQTWKNALAQPDFLSTCEGEIISIQEWEDQLAICESLRWHEGKLQGLCCGEWTDIPTDGTAPIPGEGGQPSSGTRPGPGESNCFTVEVLAGQTWLLPFGVQDGDVITVTDLNGAWSNGDPAWTCYDGTPFVLGACIGSRYHLGGDPDATLYHGQLALKIGANYYSATDGPFTVPGGVPMSTLTIQGNFERTVNNGGSVKFKVCVENGSAPPVGDWCFSFDFTLSDYGWYPVPYLGNPQGVYVMGEGFAQYVPTTTSDSIQIHTPAITGDMSITRMVIELDAVVDDYTPRAYMINDDDTAEIAHVDGLGPEYDIVADYEAGGVIAAFDPQPGSSVLTDRKIVRVTLYGTGENPFGSDNC